MPLTKPGKEVALLADEVLARVKALNMQTPVLLTYRVQMRCTLRSEPGGAILSRLGPTKDGKPHLVTGRAPAGGWVEIVEGAATLGYVKAGALRALP